MKAKCPPTTITHLLPLVEWPRDGEIDDLFPVAETLQMMRFGEVEVRRAQDAAS